MRKSQNLQQPLPPPTRWVQRADFRCQAWQQTFSPTESSCQPRSLHFQTGAACHSEPTFNERYTYFHFRDKKREFTAHGNEEQMAKKTKAQSPGSWLASCLHLFLVRELPAAHKHPQGRMFPSMHLMNRVACVLETLEIDPHRGMWNVEWTTGECGCAQQGGTHPTAPRWQALWVVWKLFSP